MSTMDDRHGMRSAGTAWLRAFVIAGLLAVMLAFAAAVSHAPQAEATPGEPYSYTIRVYCGNYGTYNGVNPYVVTVAAGGSFTLDEDAVTVTDSKYYVKGFRVSGQDDLSLEAITVQKDMDFVVAYGVAGEMVSYTVNFVEYGTGQPLANDEGATSKTFYGKEGDKPIVPFEYVPGYRPRYLNITGTLGPEGTNSWTLEYIAVAAESDTSGTSGGGTSGSGSDASGGTGGGSSTDGTTPSDGSPSDGTTPGGTDADGTTPDGTTPDGTTPDGTTPDGTTPDGTEPPTEEIIDVDNPLSGDTDDGNGGDGDGGRTGHTPVGLIFGIAAGAVGIAAVIIALARRKKSSRTDV